MKPFDLELAKAGHPVCTRDGRAVRILCYDFITQEDTPIIALVRLSEKQEGIICYKADGRNFAPGMAELDLVMVPEKREGWVNVFINSCSGLKSTDRIYFTKAEALKCIDTKSPRYIDTVKIEWEE